MLFRSPALSAPGLLPAVPASAMPVVFAANAFGTGSVVRAVTLRVADGGVFNATAAGEAGITVAGNGSPILVLTGTADALSAYLSAASPARVTYTGIATRVDAEGTRAQTLSVSVDLGTNRSEAEIADAQSTPLSELRQPQTDAERVVEDLIGELGAPRFEKADCHSRKKLWSVIGLDRLGTLERGVERRYRKISSPDIDKVMRDVRESPHTFLGHIDVLCRNNCSFEKGDCLGRFSVPKSARCALLQCEAVRIRQKQIGEECIVTDSGNRLLDIRGDDDLIGEFGPRHKAESVFDFTVTVIK